MRQQALGIAKQACAVGGARCVLDLVEKLVEFLGLVAPVVIGLGKVAQIKRLHMRNDGQVVVLVGVGARQPLCPFHILQLELDADLGQLGCNQLAALARIGRGRQRHGQRQRGLDASFSHQSLGFFQVKGVDTCGVHIAKGRGHIVAADGHAIAIGSTGNHGLAIDGGGNGTAHADVAERLSRIVDGQNGLGARVAHHHLKAGIGFELRHAARRDAREGIDIAGQQGCNLCCGIGDEAEHGALDANALCRAIAGPGGQRDRCALGPGRQLVGAGAHGLAGVGGGALGFDNDGGCLTHHEQKVGIDLLVGQHHRMLVGDLGAQIGKGALVLVGAFVGCRAVERELDGGSVEGLAVLELHILAQAKGIGLEIGRDFPAFGQQRRDAAVGVDLGQRLKHVVEHDFGNRGSSPGCGVQSWRLQRHGQRDTVFLGLGHGRPGSEQGQAGSRAGQQGAAIEHQQSLRWGGLAAWGHQKRCKSSRGADLFHMRFYTSRSSLCSGRRHIAAASVNNCLPARFR